MPAARDLDLLFPTGGIDVSWGHDMQPGGTTAAGVNVRAFEARTQRVRGGSRPGLSRYIDATVAGTHLIQHLNVIVDPTTDALLDTFDPDPTSPDVLDDPSSDGNGVPVGGGSETFTGDPSHGGNRNRNPGRLIRRGGSGRQPNKHRPQAKHVTITALSVVKNEGDTYTFHGDEFTTSGLQAGASVSSVTLTSTGSPADATPGDYPIVISAAVGTGLSHYRITYVNGLLSIPDVPLTPPKMFVISSASQLVSSGANDVHLVTPHTWTPHYITTDNHWPGRYWRVVHYHSIQITSSSADVRSFVEVVASGRIGVGSELSSSLTGAPTTWVTETCAEDGVTDSGNFLISVNHYLQVSNDGVTWSTSPIF